MQKLPDWLRWILMIPGGVVAGLLAQFPLQWAIQTFSSGSHPCCTASDYLAFNLGPFVFWFLYVVVGAWIAPKSQLAAIGLLIIFVGLLGFKGAFLGVHIILSGILAPIAGAVLGLVIVYFRTRKMPAP